VTVAAHSQKQVAMIQRDNVPVEILYRSRIAGGSGSGVRMLLRMNNERAEGLGLPLPAGGFALFRKLRGRPFLLGEGATDDKAVGEKVDVELRDAANVRLVVRSDSVGNRQGSITLTVTNALPKPVRYEAEIRAGDAEKLFGFPRGVGNEDGKWVWRTIIPANGKRTLTYRAQYPG
jgi:hypothetical protein